MFIVHTDAKGPFPFPATQIRLTDKLDVREVSSGISCPLLTAFPDQCKELRMFLEARVWAIESSSSSASISSLAGGVAMGRALFSLSKDADDVLRRITGAGIGDEAPSNPPTIARFQPICGMLYHVRVCEYV